MVSGTPEEILRRWGGPPLIRVLLADDHRVVRDGLRRLVEGAGDMEVVAEAADGREAIRKTRETSPDVAVVDISMPGLDGLEVIRQIRLENPKLPVLVLTMPEEGQSVVRTIEAGAKGYLTKRSAAVDTYRARLLRKLSLRNNAELTRFAIQNCVVEL
jgi:two-component system invasion response regulator UvrY